MKKYLVVIASLFWFALVVGSPAAVDKKDKKSPAKVENKVVAKKGAVAAKKIPAKKPNVSPSKVSKLSGKKVDSFIDKNKNGIDDRKEQLVDKADTTKAASSKAKKTEQKKK
ncbi:MAG: hypothetical protein ABIE70_06735 [bacterium]